MDSKEAFIALNMLPRIGPVRVRKLIDHLGSAEQVLSSSTDKLMRVQGVGPQLAQLISGWQDAIDLTKEINEAESREIKIITQADSDFPKPLLEMYDTPLVLYVWGELSSVDDKGIAVVGSRNYSHYGQQSARRLSFQLAHSGVTVLSGLARGIDTFSHEGAIAAGGRTVAVIGSGLAQVYPPENMELAGKIAAGHGAVISEFPLFVKPNKNTFPMRNRIVAGWSSGVLVVESPLWSGSQITANLANEMGKQVYAIPGQIDSPSSAGCHELIRNGATLVTSAEDILADFETLPLSDLGSVEKQVEVNPALLSLSEKERGLLDCLSSSPVLMDELVDRTRYPLPELSVLLMQMELKKLIERLPGQRYVRRDSF